jgi:hypothetical protein
MARHRRVVHTTSWRSTLSNTFAGAPDLAIVVSISKRCLAAGILSFDHAIYRSTILRLYSQTG